jgi:hypothetical protein
MRIPLGGSATGNRALALVSPLISLSLDTVTSRHASLRTWRARFESPAAFTEIFLATSNVVNPGEPVTGSIWAVRSSNPVPLVSRILGSYHRETAHLVLRVPPADTLPFTGEFLGRFLSWREGASPTSTTIPFTPIPSGDWWVANCQVGAGGTFILGINDVESQAMMVISGFLSAKLLAEALYGLWLSTDGTPQIGGAA